MKGHGMSTQNIYNKYNDLQIECYNRNMNCLGCFYSQYNTVKKCRVKKSIIEHILKYGIPQNLKTKGVRND